MAAWLAEHPQVFMSNPKEPLFFNTDMSWHGVSKLKAYLELFRKVKTGCHAVGEASVFYLYSRDAVKNILDFQPNARFIVMLRNPLEVAQSLHTQFRYDDMEPIEDFEQAWKSPLSNRPVGSRCTDPSVLQYKNVVLFGKQVERLQSVVNPINVMYIFMDDLQKNASHEYQRILNFLGVPDDGRVVFPSYNQSKIYRRKWLNRARTILAKSSRSWFPISLKNYLLKLNYTPYKPELLRPEFELELLDQMRDDIMLLSRLVNRDLSDWMRAKNLQGQTPNSNGEYI